MSSVNEWPMVKLGDVCTLDFGAAFKSSQFNTEGRGLPVIRIRDVNRGFSATFYEGDFEARYLVTNGDFLIGMDGNFSIAEWNGGQALLNQRVCRVARDTADHVHPRYIFHFLPQALVEIHHRKSFVTVKHLSAKDLRELKIPLPPLAEQQRIAEILDVNQRQFDLLTARKTNLASLRTGLVDQILEADDRETLPLKEIAEIQSGITKGRKIPKGKILTETAYMAVSNVKDGHLNLEAVKTIPATETEITRFRLKAGDVLLTEGGDPDKLGRGTVWRDEIEPCLHQNHIFRVRLPEDSRFTPEVLMAMLSTKQARAYFFRSAKQTTGIASINKTQLSAVPVPILTDSEIAKLSEALTQIDILSSYIEKRRIATESLHRALSTRAFAGQL